MAGPTVFAVRRLREHSNLNIYMRGISMAEQMARMRLNAQNVRSFQPF